MPAIGDGRDAETQAQLGMDGRIPHEVSVQPTFQGCLVKIIMGKREMVHADFPIAGFLEHFSSKFVERPFLGTGGKVFFGEFSLSNTFYPGNMGITVKGNPIRAEFVDVPNRMEDAFLSLQRKTVDEIEVEGGVPDVSRMVRDRGNLFEGLNSVDDVLNLGIEVFDAETEAPESESEHGFEMISRGEVRVGLEREFMGFGYADIAQQGFDQSRKVPRTEEGWRSTAHVEFPDPWRVIQKGTI